MSSNPDPLAETLKCLASGAVRPKDIQELQQAMSSGRVTIASNGGIAIGGSVSGGIVAGSLVLPPEILKLLKPPYRPPALPSPEVLADRGSLPPGTRLPFSPNAVFTGRQEDLLGLARALLYAQEGSEGSDQAEVVVNGMGGIGKTQLAVELCCRYGRFFQGVHWLQANLDMQAEVVENGQVMNLPCWPDKLPEQVQATLNAWQEDGGRRLIVLDNVEDLDVLQTWLPKLQPNRLLVTSRRENWPPDLGLKVRRLEVLSRSQSIELLRKLAPKLKAETNESLGTLAGYLGDLPLALDLAGRYLADRSNLSIEGYLVELQKAGSALEHTSLRDWADHSPTKHITSLIETFSLSWQQLTGSDELAKQLFRLGGYCAPNTPIPLSLLANAVGANVPDYELDRALRKLDSLGLMDRAEDGRRMHSLLAEFARLQDHDTEESVLSSLAGAMVTLTTEALKSGLPENMKPLREHLDTIALAAERSKLQITGSLWNNLGMYLHNLADYERAKGILKRALKIDETAYGPDHPNVAIRVNNIGMVLQELGELQEARIYLERALKIDETAYGPDHPNVAIRVNNIGMVLRDLGELKGARKCYERALKIDETAHGPDHPNVATYVNNLGLVLQALGELKEARKCYERALKIDETAYGPDHPNVARDVNNIGSVLRDLGELKEARIYLERALKIDEKVYGLDHHNVATDVNNIGMVLRDLGELKEARKCYERALKIDETAYGPDHPNVAIRVNNIGMVLRDLGELKEARKYLERALKIDEKVYGPNNPNVATDVYNLGSVLRDLGELKEARKCYERALDICQKRRGEDHPTTKTVRSNLNSVLHN